MEVEGGYAHYIVRCLELDPNRLTSNSVSERFKKKYFEEKKVRRLQENIKITHHANNYVKYISKLSQQYNKVINKDALYIIKPVLMSSNFVGSLYF